MKRAPAGRRRLALSKVYGFLEPGPVVLVTTIRDGRANVMPLSWHTMMEFEPPLVGLVMSDANHSFASLAASRECVINIPTVEIAEKVVGCGNTSGRAVDKFERFELTALPATRVHPPLVRDCYASFECRIADDALVDKYNFFILEVVAAWIDPAVKDPRTLHHRGWGRFMIAGRTRRISSAKR